MHAIMTPELSFYFHNYQHLRKDIVSEAKLWNFSRQMTVPTARNGI